MMAGLARRLFGGKRKGGERRSPGRTEPPTPEEAVARGIVFGKARPFASLEQLVANYYAALAIKEISVAQNAALMRGELYLSEYLFFPDVARPDLVAMFHEISAAVNGDLAVLIIAATAIEHMEAYRFDLDPSVIDVRDDNKHLEREFKSGYTRLANVALMRHTMNVVEEFLRISRNQDANTKGVALLGCLLHDFGKSTRIRQKMADAQQGVALKAIRHPDASAYYVDEILEPAIRARLGDEFDSAAIRPVYEYAEKLLSVLGPVVASHHHAAEGLKAYIAPIMRADGGARQKEIKQLKELER